MSTKTTFKRIALVAVAALGLGVLSVAPSSAVVSGVAVTTTNGTAGLAGVASDTVTGAQISVSALMDNGLGDSITVSFIQRTAAPAGAVVVPVLQFLDTTTGTLASSTQVSPGTKFSGTPTLTFTPAESVTAASAYTITGSAVGTATYVGANFALYLDSKSSTNRLAGTYGYTVLVKQYANTGSAPQNAVTTTTYNVDITVAKDASASTTVAPALTTAFIGAITGPTADAAVAAVATNDATPDAFIQLNLYNAAGSGTSNSTGVVDSVTATVAGPGLVSFDGITYGKSIKVASTGSQSIRVLADGTAGVSTITITTLSGFTTTKSVTFYAKAAKTITATVNYPVLAVGANTGAVAVSAVDANGTPWTGSAYIVAATAADALVAGSATTPVACAAWTSTDGILCPVTAIAAGTANFKVIDAATVALATATSNTVAVTVSAASVASVKLAFDKSTYAPFEKAYITVTPLDKDGKTLPAGDRQNLLTTGGITTNIAFGSQSDTLTATRVTSAAANGTGVTAGSQTYVVYMPATGAVTIKATGGTALPLAGQVAISATASVVNSSVDAATDAANEATDAANAATDAALAAADAADAATAAAQDASDAVAALSATVDKLVASLKAQITSLTNLVIKIQKKVKA